MVCMKVALFTLGGTIASTYAPGPAEDSPAARGVAPGLHGADLLAPVPGLIGAGFHDALKARMLLHLLLAAGAGREQIAAAFGAVGADLATPRQEARPVSR